MFVANRDDFMTRKIKDILKENQRDIDTLLGGPTRLIVAERRNNNIASTLFAKSSFSQCLTPEGENQKCESASNRCMTCDLMDLDRTVVLWKNHPDRRQTLKLDFRCDCATEYVIYIYICKHCEFNDNFYVGQSVNTARARANGHRSPFNRNDYKQSALSHHVFIDHPDKMEEKLKDFRLGVIKCTTPMNLDRLEDFYVIKTDAELSLNRYKVVS